MKLKTLLLVAAATTLAAAPRLSLAQYAGSGPLDRTVAWFTGDGAVGEGPSSGLKNYAEDTYCDTGNCGCCSQCWHQHDVWGSVEFLMWWGRGTSLPPLVTTAPDATPIATAGNIGDPNTTITFGNQLAASKMQGGGRITAGIWLDPDHNVAAGGRFFGLGGDSTRFNQASSAAGSPIITRPFFDASLNNTPSALVVAYPGVASGRINAFDRTNNIMGVDAFAEIMMVRDGLRRVDLVGGYQFFRMDDWLQIDSSSTRLTAPFLGLQTDVQDRFSTRNQFHGGEIGLRARMARGQWSLNMLGQIGLGNMNQQVTIAGTTSVTPTGGPTTTGNTGGLLTAPTNIGVHERNKFAYIPQLTANLNYHYNPSLSFHIGYNILWISDVALSGDQVDQFANFAFPAAAPPRPAFVFQDRSYWFQGINLGANWDF